MAEIFFEMIDKVEYVQMVDKIVKKWEANKYKLEQKFKTLEKNGCYEYLDIVKYIFEFVINESESFENYDVSKITVIDDGHYEGTQIFIIPRDTYTPNVSDYLMTDTYYGSCSGCDTLLAILDNYEASDDGCLNNDQVSDLMTLSLHLIQKMRPLSEE